MAEQMLIVTVEQLNALPRYTVLIDNRWDLWRVTDPGRSTLHGGRRTHLNAPWEHATDGQVGIFPFEVVWTPDWDALVVAVEASMDRRSDDLD